MKIETRGSKRQCALCLTSCGLGLKRIASMLGTVHPAVYRWRKEAGISGMIGPRMGKGVLKGSWDESKYQRHAFNAEQSKSRTEYSRLEWTRHSVCTRSESDRYYKANSERIRDRSRKTWHANKHDPSFRQKRKLAHRDWVKRNKEKVKEIQKRWLNANPEKREEYKIKNREWRKTSKGRESARRINSTPRMKVLRSVRTRLRDVLECKHSSSCLKLTGVSASVLRDYIASLFTRGMTWDNYGKHWHIDHIVPCAAFDMTRPDEVKRCFHFTNLRPLEAKKNMAKGSKFNPSTLELPMAYDVYVSKESVHVTVKAGEQRRPMVQH